MPNFVKISLVDRISIENVLTNTHRYLYNGVTVTPSQILPVLLFCATYRLIHHWVECSKPSQATLVENPKNTVKSSTRKDKYCFDPMKNHTKDSLTWFVFDACGGGRLLWCGKLEKFLSLLQQNCLPQPHAWNAHYVNEPLGWLTSRSQTYKHNFMQRWSFNF